MKSLPIIYGAVTVGALGFALALPFMAHRKGAASVPGWQDIVNPGPLSSKHAFLASNCEACHTPHRGIVADKCIVCHASNESLIAKQTTAFHADIGECRGCHTEHLGVDHRPIAMDHVVLAAAGAKAHALPPGISLESLPVQHPRINPGETALDCNACHGNQDPHRTLFGTDCAACHGTGGTSQEVWTSILGGGRSTISRADLASISRGGWNIPEFRHPSPLSTDCMQCHQAPPSHYMMHFQMVSMPVARIEHANVTQCFLCHQTNAWNDIKGVGWYKHH